MSSQPIANFLVRLDRVCDYVPVLSTATNIVNIALKIILKCNRDVRSPIYSNFYAQHLTHKSFKRCIVLSIPGIGNLIIGIIDHAQKKKLLNSEGRFTYLRERYYLDDETFVREGIQKGKIPFGHISKRLQDNNEIARMAMERDAFAYRWASSRVQGLNQDIAREVALQTNIDVLGEFPQFAGDEEVALHAIKKSFAQMEFVSKELKDSEAFVRKALELDIFCFPWISERLKSDKSFVKEYLIKLPSLMDYMSDEIKNDVDFIKELIVEKPNILIYVSDKVKNDRKILKELIDINPLVVRNVVLRNSGNLYQCALKKIYQSLNTDQPFPKLPIPNGIFEEYEVIQFINKYKKDWNRVFDIPPQFRKTEGVKSTINELQNSDE